MDEREKIMQLDMTKGEPGKLIRTFIIPIIIGNLCQQLYSMTDTIIVGRTLGVDALAAVGATGTIMGVMLGFLIGFSAGMALYCSQKFGAKDIEGLKKGVGNTIGISLILTIVGTGLAVFFIEDILQIMNTPGDIFERSLSYISVICWGFICMVAYNVCASLLRAVGNSKAPLYFLVISSVLNIALDLIFILICQWGVAGAALATVVSQGVSALLCMGYIVWKVPMLHISFQDISFDRSVIKKQIAMGLPMGLQYSIIGLGTVILQSALNSLGTVAVAAYTAAIRIEWIVIQPYPALGITMAAYASQNKGSGNMERIHAGVKKALQYNIGYSLLAMAAVNFFLPYLLPVFVEGDITELLGYARTFTFVDSLCYLPLGCIFLYRETLQGVGKSLYPMMSGVLELVSRILLAVLAAKYASFFLVCLANGGTWIVTAIFLGLCYYVVLYRKFKTSTSFDKIGE